MMKKNQSHSERTAKYLKNEAELLNFTRMLDQCNYFKLNRGDFPPSVYKLGRLHCDKIKGGAFLICLRIICALVLSNLKIVDEKDDFRFIDIILWALLIADPSLKKSIYYHLTFDLINEIQNSLKIHNIIKQYIFGIPGSGIRSFIADITNKIEPEGLILYDEFTQLISDYEIEKSGSNEGLFLSMYNCHGINQSFISMNNRQRDNTYISVLSFVQIRKLLTKVSLSDGGLLQRIQLFYLSNVTELILDKEVAAKLWNGKYKDILKKAFLSIVFRWISKMDITSFNGQIQFEIIAKCLLSDISDYIDELQKRYKYSDYLLQTSLGKMFTKIKQSSLLDETLERELSLVFSGKINDLLIAPLSHDEYDKLNETLTISAASVLTSYKSIFKSTIFQSVFFNGKPLNINKFFNKISNLAKICATFFFDISKNLIGKFFSIECVGALRLKDHNNVHINAKEANILLQLLTEYRLCKSFEIKEDVFIFKIYALINPSVINDITASIILYKIFTKHGFDDTQFIQCRNNSNILTKKLIALKKTYMKQLHKRHLQKDPNATMNINEKVTIITNAVNKLFSNSEQFLNSASSVNEYVKSIGDISTEGQGIHQMDYPRNDKIYGKNTNINHFYLKKMKKKYNNFNDKDEKNDKQDNYEEYAKRLDSIGGTLEAIVDEKVSEYITNDVLNKIYANVSVLSSDSNSFVCDINEIYKKKSLNNKNSMLENNDNIMLQHNNNNINNDNNNNNNIRLENKVNNMILQVPREEHNNILLENNDNKSDAMIIDNDAQINMNDSQLDIDKLSDNLYNITLKVSNIFKNIIFRQEIDCSSVSTLYNHIKDDLVDQLNAISAFTRIEINEMMMNIRNNIHNNDQISNKIVGDIIQELIDINNPLLKTDIIFDIICKNLIENRLDEENLSYMINESKRCKTDEILHILSHKVNQYVMFQSRCNVPNIDIISKELLTNICEFIQTRIGHEYNLFINRLNVFIHIKKQNNTFGNLLKLLILCDKKRLDLDLDDDIEKICPFGIILDALFHVSNNKNKNKNKRILCLSPNTEEIENKERPKKQSKPSINESDSVELETDFDIGHCIIITVCDEQIQNMKNGKKIENRTSKLPHSQNLVLIRSKKTNEIESQICFATVMSNVDCSEAEKIDADFYLEEYNNKKVTHWWHIKESVILNEYVQCGSFQGTYNYCKTHQNVSNVVFNQLKNMKLPPIMRLMINKLSP